jgi:hypothetical protein
VNSIDYDITLFKDGPIGTIYDDIYYNNGLENLKSYATIEKEQMFAWIGCKIRRK